MGMYILWAITVLLSVGALAAVFMLYRGQKKMPEGRISTDATELRKAEAKAKEIILEAKDEAMRLRKKTEEELQRRQQDLQRSEKNLTERGFEVDKKYGILEERKRFFDEQERKISEKEKEIEEIKTRQFEKLQRVAGLTKDEAKNLILSAVEKSLESEISRKIKEHEEQVKEEADKKAKEIVVTAIQRAATDYVAEYTTSTVNLPDDEMKGRIIGREGRNIKAFETATGVNVEIDETPGVIILSSFDSVRREVARRSMERLIADGRIQPSRIEEVVQKTQKEVEKIIHEAGEELVYKTGVVGLPREIIDTLGRFKFRTSYGQNMISHTLEVVNIGKLIATEIGVDARVVKAACLLHDIGKVLTAETEGPHTQIGADLLRRHGVSEKIIETMESHHEEKPFKSIEGIIVYIADAISGARPGARYEDYESYVKRITELETVATSYVGVEKAYAMQAGREVRVIVIPDKVDDAGISKMAHDIAEKIHNEVVYPGTVKVTVIREKRAVEVAK